MIPKTQGTTRLLNLALLLHVLAAATANSRPDFGSPRVFFEDNDARDSPRLLQSLSDDPTLFCRIYLVDILEESSNGAVEGDSFYQCNPINANGEISDFSYGIGLPANIDAQHRAHRNSDLSADFIVSIPNGEIRQTDVFVPDESSVNVVKDPPLTRRSRARSLIASTGKVKTMVLRLVDRNDSRNAPQYSKEDIHRLVFTDDVSLKGQYQKCSWGKLTFTPVGDGVFDVPVSFSKEPTEMVNEASESAVEMAQDQQDRWVESLYEFADVVYVIT